LRLLILGPPGAGKGTQAARVAERYGIPAISTGDIFRKNIADRTPLGLRVDEIVKSGGYVPDEVTNDLIRDRLSWPDAAGGFLLDGYPRTLAQVAELDRMLTAAGTVLDAVLELTAEADEVVERLLKRAEIEGRADDNEEVIRHRQKVYVEQTAPLSEVYAARGLLRSVDGMGEVDDVTARLVATLGAQGA
jgi:adenylate kinase